MSSVSENVSVDGRKITWSYERKVGRPNYGSESIGLFVTDLVPENMSAMECVEARSEAAFSFLRSQVLKALGFPPEEEQV